MPYIHYESFNKQNNTRTMIRAVNQSKRTVENIALGIHQSVFPDLEQGQTRDKDLPIESSNFSMNDLRRRMPMNVMDMDSTSEMSLLKAYLYHKPSLHIRRSLDQYFYSSLIDDKNTDRDRSQILLRFEGGIDPETSQKHESQLPTNLSSLDLHDVWTSGGHERYDLRERIKQVGDYRKENRPIVMVD